VIRLTRSYDPFIDRDQGFCAEFTFFRSCLILPSEGRPVKLESVGEVIAARALMLLRDRGAASEVLVLLGKPQQLPDHQDYYCPYQIKGAGPEKVRYACGIDPFQALQLALSTLGVELEVLNKELGGKLRWECDAKGGLGFPDFA
jgi:hypothetical protein